MSYRCGFSYPQGAMAPWAFDYRAITSTASMSFGGNKMKKRRAWAIADVRTLKAAAKRKAPAARIARSLKRTEGATRQKAFSLGISLDSRA
jgi:hypothetical protein